MLMMMRHHKPPHVTTKIRPDRYLYYYCYWWGEKDSYAHPYMVIPTHIWVRVLFGFVKYWSSGSRASSYYVIWLLRSRPITHRIQIKLQFKKVVIFVGKIPQFQGFPIILYLKFKLSNQKTIFVPRDSVIFYGISLKFMISQCSVRYYNVPRPVDPPWDIIVSHAWRVDTTVWNNLAFASCCL
jgi:hypothetical protein